VFLPARTATFFTKVLSGFFQGLPDIIRRIVQSI
jgi:hypothetical protein